MLHRFGCPYVIWTMGVATLGMGAIIGATILLGRPYRFDLTVLVLLFCLFFAMLIAWIVLGKIRRE